jgi:hypothetical protein
MKRSRFSEEQIIGVLKEAEATGVKAACAKASHQRNIFQRQKPLSARKIIFFTSGQRLRSALTNNARIAQACLAESILLWRR